MKIEITEEQYKMAKKLLKQSMSDPTNKELKEFTSEIIGKYQWAKMDMEENEPNT